MWFIRYKAKGTPGIRSVSALEVAIEHACDLLDQGATVNEIKNDAVFNTVQITSGEIARHYHAKRKLLA
jgi:hypothetical protein